jgi:diguanylate cyclase (GGDEF)-like protein
LRFTLLACLSLVAANALALLLTRHSVTAGWLADFFFLILTRALLSAAYLWRATKAVSLRKHWILIGSGMLLAAIALSIDAWIFFSAAILHHFMNTAASDYANLILSLGGVPVIILLTLPSTGKSYSMAFFWIDTVIAILWGYIVYLKLFGVIPFTHAAIHPASNQTQIILNVATGVVVLVVAFLRFISATTVDERNFLRFFTISLLISDVMLDLHDIVAGGFATATYYDLLGTIPMLISLLLVLMLPDETSETSVPMPPGKIAEVLNIACPSLLTIMLIGAGVDAMRHFFNFGIGVMAIGFTLYLVRSVIIQRNLEQSERSLKEARDKLEAISLTDALTGVANRRCFDNTLVTEWNRAVRTQSALSLLIMDIDHFKHLNDTQGHQAGDDCIIMVAKAIRDCLPRSGDLLARYGGEEFCVILPTTDSKGVQTVAHKMREAVHSLAIPNETSAGPYVSISVGIATCYFPTNLTAHQLFAAVDKALYRAKENGRNRVEVALSSVLL